MPTYDYECNACGHKFELFQSITAPSVRKCPACAKLKVRRLIGAGAGIIFKGSGFYQTDYRSDSYRQAAKKDSGATSTASSGSSSPSSTTTGDSSSTTAAAGGGSASSASTTSGTSSDTKSSSSASAASEGKKKAKR